MKELDVVKSITRISEKVDEGCIGTIVMELTNPRLAYLIEFFDENENTIDIIPVEPKDVELIYSN